MSLRRRIRSAAAAANDAINADEGTIVFMTAGDQDTPAGVDPAHPALPVLITDLRSEEIEGMEGDRRGVDFSAILPGAAVLFLIARERFAAARMPRMGDRAVLFDGSRWRIERTHDDGVARLLLAVTPISGEGLWP